jgi:hypothetical protein
MRYKLILLLVLILSSVSRAETYYVRTGGDDSHDGSLNTDPCAWLTIQHALETVASGSTIHVADGTYDETKYHYILIDESQNGKVITVQGEGDGTIVNGSNGNFVLVTYGTIGGNSSITFKDMMFYGNHPAFVSIGVPNTTLILDNITILDDGTDAKHRNVGVQYASNVTSASLIVRNCRIITEGMGILIPYYAAATRGIIEIYNNIIDNNNNSAADGNVAVYIGVDGDKAPNPIGNVKFYNNTVRFIGKRTSHALLIGKGANGGYYAYNDVNGGDIALVVKGNYNTIENNIFRTPWSAGDINYAGLIKGGSYNTVRNNTFVTNYWAAFVVANGVSDACSAGNVIVNNICYNNKVAPDNYALCCRNDPCANNIINNNCYYGGASPIYVNGVGKSLAEAQTWWNTLPCEYGNDSNSISADPLFVDAANSDFSLLPASPCINAVNTLNGGKMTIGAWQPKAGGFDSNYDGRIDFFDFAEFAQHWLEGVAQ